MSAKATPRSFQARHAKGRERTSVAATIQISFHHCSSLDSKAPDASSALFGGRSRAAASHDKAAARIPLESGHRRARQRCLNGGPCPSSERGRKKRRAAYRTGGRIDRNLLILIFLGAHAIVVLLTAFAGRRSGERMLASLGLPSKEIPELQEISMQQQTGGRVL